MKNLMIAAFLLLGTPVFAFAQTAETSTSEEKCVSTESHAAGAYVSESRCEIKDNSGTRVEKKTCVGIGTSAGVGVVGAGTSVSGSSTRCTTTTTRKPKP